MSPTVTSRAEPVVVTNSAGFRSKLPRRLRAVILLVLTLGLKSALWSAVAPVLGIGYELKTISKRQDDLVHPLATFAFKAFITWFGWRLDYDCKSHEPVRCATPLNPLAPRHRYWRSDLDCQCAVRVSLVNFLRGISPCGCSHHEYRSHLDCVTDISLAPSV